MTPGTPQQRENDSSSWSAVGGGVGWCGERKILADLCYEAGWPTNLEHELVPLPEKQKELVGP